MFGFGQNKVKPKVISQAPEELPKTPQFDINNEVVFHIMPTRFKKQNADAKQAQKTGLLIMVIALVVFFSLILILAWYFFFYTKQAGNNNSPKTETDILATTSEIVATPEILSAPVISTQPEISAPSTSTDLASTSPQPEVAGELGQPEIDHQPVVVISSSTDSDNDDLTDAEEVILLSNSNNSDSDGDGYADLAEFIKGYNPGGAGKIADTKVIGIYQNANFSMQYPTVWQFTSDGNDAVIFRTNDEQMIQVSLQPNLKNQSIIDWYKEQFNNQVIADGQLLNKVDEGGNELWQGVFSPNGLTLYLTNTKKQTIVSLNYDLGFNSKLNYRQIFLYMINSFVLKN